MDAIDYFGPYEREVNNLEEFAVRVDQVESLAAAAGLSFYWRGQADARWGVHSLLHRGIAAATGCDIADVPEREVVTIEQQLVVEARDWIRPAVGARLTSVDLFARLQHFGIPTRLVDFSRDPGVALFFAVSSYPDSDGRLVIAAARHEMEPAALTDFAVPWASGSTTRPRDWSANLFALDDQADFLRIIRQDGVFLVGGTPSTSPQRRRADNSENLLAREVRTAVSLPLALHRWSQAEAATTGMSVRGRTATVASALTLRIPSESKAALRRALEAERGVSFARLFPDPEGYRNYSQVVATVRLDTPPSKQRLLT